MRHEYTLERREAGLRRWRVRQELIIDFGAGEPIRMRPRFELFWTKSAAIAYIASRTWRTAPR